MGTPTIDLEHSCWTAEYLLDHCERYRVESADGRLGFVEEVVRSRDCEPVALRVRSVRGALPLVIVPMADVLEVHPHGERIVVRADAAAPAPVSA